MRLRFILVCITLLTLVSAGSAGNIRPASAAGLTSISVVGNHFVDANGATIRLLGVNRSGSEYMCTGGGSNIFDGPSDDASIAAMASWHLNVVRLGLNEDCWLGINGLPVSPLTATAYRAAIVDYVNRLHAQGMYAILELHWNAPGTNKSVGQQVMVDADHGPAFWASVATTFKSDSKVLFDLYNEPQGISWACLRDGCMAGFQTVGMQSLVNTVRATGATQPITVGGLGYSGDLSQWLSYRPTDSQIAASFHTYDFVGNCNNLSCASTLLPIAASVPLVTGELGETDCAHGYIDKYMPWADTNGISYLGWAWDAYDCTFPSLISAYNGAPTSFGIGFRDHLAALAGNHATVTLVTPNSGPAAGGTSVSITGTSFTAATAVKFGTAAATTYTVNSATQIAATSPPGSGVVDVTVTTANGTSATSSADLFTYLGPPGPPTVSSVVPNSGADAGGTSVSITGANFTAATAVMFGTVAATTYAVNSATQIAATSPPGSGVVDVTVTTASGTSATSAADRFTYVAPPTVNSVVPNSGPAAGGTSVSITGTNFTAATAVKFGTRAATAYAVNSATQITATSPLGSGIVDVTVTTAGGTSGTSAADSFTYVAPPRLSSVVPNNGPAAGGTSVIITGANFTAATAVKFGTVAATTYTVNSATQIAATSPPGSGVVDVTVTTPNGSSATSSADLFTYVQRAGPYHSLSPNRILDTRTSVGGHWGRLGPRGAMTVQITGKGGIPSAGVSAVIMNVTVTTTSASSFLTIYPAGVPRPLASNLNWVGGRTVSNLVEVAVGVNGQVTVYNGAGSTDVIFDVSGYVSIPTGTPGTDGLYTPVVPSRILDTRNGNGGYWAKVGPGETINVQVGGRSGSGVPATGVSAVVLNLTGTGATAPSYLIVYPMGATRPLASNLNFVTGQTVSNRVIVKIGANPQTSTSGWVSIYNGAGSVNVMADVGGWFTDGTDPAATGAGFVGITPTRLIDTRRGHGPIGASRTLVLPVAGHDGVPATATAVVLSVTVTRPTAPSFMTVWPDGATRPLTSDLNYVTGLTVPNLVVVKVGTSGAVNFYNGVGSTDVVVDLVGWYW
jgi:hypothetical protein